MDPIDEDRMCLDVIVESSSGAFTAAQCISGEGANAILRIQEELQDSFEIHSGISSFFWVRCL